MITGSRNILAQDEAQPATARGGARGANTSGDWAHTRNAKPAPYLGSDPQWQSSEPMSSESRRKFTKQCMHSGACLIFSDRLLVTTDMGRATEMTAAEATKFTEDARKFCNLSSL